MVKYEGKHSYALKLLAKKGINLFINNKKINFNFSDIFEKPFFQTRLQIGRKTDRPINIKQITYNDLLKLGFQITSKRASGKSFYGQKVEYYLIKSDILKHDMGYIPEGHRVDYDVSSGRIKLFGKNSSQGWIFFKVKQQRDINRKITIDSLRNLRKQYDSKLLTGYGHLVEEKSPELIIPEIPLMIAEDNRRLVCLPEGRDNPIICISGERRKGKSFLKHRIADGIYNKWNKWYVILNDALRETGTYCLDWEGNNKFIKGWEAVGMKGLNYIGEPTIPLPIIYLHPKTNSLRNLIHSNEVGFEISLPFKEVISDIDNFFEGSEAKLQPKSAQRLRNLIFDDEGKIRLDGLLSKKNYIEMKKLVEQEIPEKQILLKDAINNFLRDLCNQKIFDITNNISPFWEYTLREEIKKEYPWNCCLNNSIIPSFVTSDLRTKPYFPYYIKFILDNLFYEQTENHINEKNQTELFIDIDEIQSLLKYKIINSAICRVVRESGMARIGMMYVPQNINKVPEDIILNTQTVISFNCKRQQAKALSDNFEMVSYKEKELTTLKRFQAMLFTSDEYVTYDLVDGTKEVSDEPIRGTILPPNSQHQPSKKRIKEED